jgi:signal recognition particle subunit SRP54
VFDSFSDRIFGIFEKLRKSGVLKENDVDAALREIRIALLEADVSLEVAKKFIADVKEKSVGQNVIKSISPGQMVTKIVHDHLVELLGETAPIDIRRKQCKVILVGLQGAGKTTTAGKLAHFFSKKNKKVIMASTDIYRPAAIEQLRILSKKITNSVFAQSENDENLSPQEVSTLALKTMEAENGEILILDTAGCLHIDEVKMDELVEIQRIVSSDETFLVVDIMTGQDAINIAKKFSESIKITGIILTRVDGDARGGVALSMRSITGCPIKFLCVGEHLDDIEPFNAERIANRLLGAGDVIALVEKAQENFSQQEAEETAQKLQSGIFTFDDLASQMEKMSKLGGVKTILKMLPQSKQLENLMNAQGISDKTIVRNLAIIRSMTKNERRNYKLLNGSRKKRISTGSGTTIQEVNKLIKQYEGVLDVFKKMRKHGGIAKIMSTIGR